MTRLDLTEHEPKDTAPDWRLWALGGLMALATALGGAWGTQMDHQLQESREAVSSMRERMSAAEVRQTGSQQQLDEIKASIKDVNTKLDQLLYRDMGAHQDSGAAARRFDK